MIFLDISENPYPTLDLRWSEHYTTSGALHHLLRGLLRISGLAVDYWNNTSCSIQGLPNLHAHSLHSCTAEEILEYQTSAREDESGNLG